jgi:hypothetical protein
MLPEHLFETKPTIGGMKVGDNGYTWSAYMIVDGKGNCFLDPHAFLTDSSNALAGIRVERRADGYHVACVVRGTKWTRIDSFAGYLPVVSFREEYPPEE